MPIYFNANYTGIAALGANLGLAKAAQEAAAKYGMYKVAEFWYRWILPQHFERGARRKYKHRKRKRGYSDIKRKFAAGQTLIDPDTGQEEKHNVVKGGLVDIAFEGHTETKAKGGHSLRVTKNGFVLKMRVPKYIMGRKRGDYPDMRKELSYITSEEAMLLGRVFWRHAQKFLKANRVDQDFK